MTKGEEELKMKRLVKGQERLGKTLDKISENSIKPMIMDSIDKTLRKFNSKNKGK